MPDETLRPRRLGPLIDPRLGDEGRLLRLLRRGSAVVLGVTAVSAMASGVRAWWQVYDLELHAPHAVAAGTRLRADAVSSGRTYTTVVIELAQGDRVDTLATLIDPGNGDGALDPRPRRLSLRTTITEATLAHFAPGPARLRATALGRSQWLRVPPPTVREADVLIAVRAP
jgi:hypothetical protein